MFNSIQQPFFKIIPLYSIHRNHILSAHVRVIWVGWGWQYRQEQVSNANVQSLPQRMTTLCSSAILHHTDTHTERWVEGQRGECTSSPDQYRSVDSRTPNSMRRI